LHKKIRIYFFSILFVIFEWPAKNQIKMLHNLEDTKKTKWKKVKVRRAHLLHWSFPLRTFTPPRIGSTPSPLYISHPELFHRTPQPPPLHAPSLLLWRANFFAEVWQPPQVPTFVSRYSRRIRLLFFHRSFYIARMNLPACSNRSILHNRRSTTTTPDALLHIGRSLRGIPKRITIFVALLAVVVFSEPRRTPCSASLTPGVRAATTPSFSACRRLLFCRRRTTNVHVWPAAPRSLSRSNWYAHIQ
jgi:hypothetical protein